MDNLKERSGGNGPFYKKNSESEKLSSGRCGNSVYVGVGIGSPTNPGVVKDDCNCPGSVGAVCGSGGGSSWLTCSQQHIRNNNNNNNATESNVQTKCNVGITTTAMTATASNATVALANATTDASFTGIGLRSEDNDGGEADSTERKTAGVASVAIATTDSSCNAVAGAAAKTNGDAVLKQNGAASTCVATPTLAHDVLAVAAAAAVMTPSDFHACTFDVFAAAAAASGTDVLSRSASLNNSTENLSYTSDNFYADDLLLLEDDIDDVDADAEEISLNSDDCVYAYRGDGADFDLALDAIASRGHGTGNTCMADDETDFLEMDFEPDPLSEVEYGSVETTPGHADAFLMQRDTCHLSGRHSATLGHYANSTAAAQRLLFSSPIDDSLPPPTTKTLQSQLLLSKNFARITMHLDQIKGENGDCDSFENTHSDHASALGMADDAVDAAASNGVINTAHSLPNALLSNFGRGLVHMKEEGKANPSKVTGAKPKRFSTFSTSSSTSSKNSSKSRNSLRSGYALTTLSNSTSFDERSASCTEFRCAAPKIAASTEVCVPAETGIVTNRTTPIDCDDSSANDDTCLDCLEREFLANTIGKAIDSNECPRCRKRSSSSSIALFKRAAQSSTGNMRCRSGSPLLFRDTRDECIFETVVGDYLQPRNVDWATSAFRDIRMLKDDRWLGDSVSCDDSGPCAGDTKLKPRVRTRVRARTCDAEVLQQYKHEEEGMNQRRPTGDSNEHLLKNFLTEKETATVPTLNLSEELLVQALDNLHVSYNLELIKSHLYYATNTATAATTTTLPSKLVIHKNLKEFRDLKHLLMHESKKHCNHHKLKRLIESATRQQVDVKFQRDPKDTATALVPVNVADILQQWVRTKNLSVLKHLDRRFVETNVLGKIANIIRQAQQRCTPRRPLPDHILVPQYYPAGVLRLIKKS